jgi:hypothetical protein
MHYWNRVASNRFVVIFRDAEGEGGNRFPSRASALKRKDCQTRMLRSGHHVSASNEDLDS